jgi:hypothetical protein
MAPFKWHNKNHSRNFILLSCTFSQSRSVSNLVGQSVGRSVGRSVSRSVGQSVGQSVGRSVGRSVSQSVSQSVGRSVKLRVETLRHSWQDFGCSHGSCGFVMGHSLCQEDLYVMYESRLKSSWTHLITASRNFVEVRWLSLFRSTSLGKRCTSYKAPPSSRKRVADRLPQASGG